MGSSSCEGLETRQHPFERCPNTEVDKGLQAHPNVDLQTVYGYEFLIPKPTWGEGLAGTMGEKRRCLRTPILIAIER